MIDLGLLDQNHLVVELHMIKGRIVVCDGGAVLVEAIGVNVFLSLLFLLGTSLHLTLTCLFSLTTEVPGPRPFSLLHTFLLLLAHPRPLTFQSNLLTYQLAAYTRPCRGPVDLRLFGVPEQHGSELAGYLLPALALRVLPDLVRVIQHLKPARVRHPPHRVRIVRVHRRRHRLPRLTLISIRDRLNVLVVCAKVVREKVLLYGGAQKLDGLAEAPRLHFDLDTFQEKCLAEVSLKKFVKGALSDS